MVNNQQTTASAFGPDWALGPPLPHDNVDTLIIEELTLTVGVNSIKW